MNKMVKNIAIGGLVTTALGLLVWMLLFLHPTFGDGQFRLRVRFPNVDKIAVGTRVTFAGKPVGEVAAINLVPEARLTANDQIFAYELALALDSHVQIYPHDEVSVKTQGLMGERTVTIMPRKLKSREEKPLSDNDLILATTGGSVEETFTTLINKVEKELDDIGQMQNDLRGAATALSATCEQATAILAQVHDSDLVGKSATVTKNLESITGALANKEGSLGKMLYNDELYNKSMAALNRSDILLSDLNNYGFLYTWSSKWKSDRKKRLDELAKFKTPEQFRRYWNEELTKIYVIMGRLEAGYAKAGENLKAVNQADLGKAYDELLTEIRMLDEKLKASRAEQQERSKSIADSTLD
jgi:phospholipid/cholesterol/gamma-HCH transport system substrate-binding protein